MYEKSTKITTDWLEVGPAYGREYKNARAAKEAFVSGQDFEMLSIHQGGRYCSIRDFAVGTRVIIRYAKLERTAVAKVQPGEMSERLDK